MAETAKSGETSINLTKKYQHDFRFYIDQALRKRSGPHFHDYHLHMFNADSDAEI